MGNTLLIAEDDKLALKALARYFRAFGFTVYPAETCVEAVKLADQHKPDCFLLDYHLGGETAAEICWFVRGNEYLKKRPIIILSGDAEQVINSYEICQADGFVEKGKRYSELLALVKRQLRRGQWDRGVLKTPDLTLNAATQRIMKGDRPTPQLSPEQFRFFAILLERSPDFVTKEEICAHVFANMPSEKQEAISSLVYRLRQKLGPQLARRIKNTRYRGWVYVQPRFQIRKPSADPNRPEKPSRQTLKV